MDPETLVTFLFRAPPSARTVELLGSWDNFSHPYRMHPDKRRGQGAWSGCFKFLDIVFDGDAPSFHKPRSGGLKQGGTYWYYYRLDDEVEAYDDARQTTVDCPLMPGQSMNVLDVPMEIAEPVARSRSASVDAVAKVLDLESVHTLDPGDKFAALAPPPISRVHARCVSEIALVSSTFHGTDSSHSSDVARPRERNPHFVMEPAIVGEEPNASCYQAFDFAFDDGSSFYSRQSWSSAACSSEHSFILDAYEIESSPFSDEDRVDYFDNHQEAPSMPSRAPPAVPDVLPPQLFTSEALPMPSRAPPAIPGSRISQPFVASDGPEASELISSSPPMPCRAPPAIPTDTPELAEADSHEDSIEYSSSSSTPPDSHIPPPCPPMAFRPDLRLDLNHLHRPRTSIHNNSTTSPLTFSPTTTSSSPNHIRTTELERLRRLSNEHDQPSNSSGEEDYDDEDEDEILSPTFSAATVSSHGGLNTPFRISIGGQLCLLSCPEDSMEKVTERLRSLGHLGGSSTANLDESLVASSTPPNFPSLVVAADETTFSHFAVERDDLGKEGGKFDFAIERAMSPQPSLADAIFSELSHLGAVIA